MKKFAQYLILAQIASNSGKGDWALSQNAQNAVRGGYEVKDKYILQAITEAQSLRQVAVSKGFHIGMTVVFFDIAGFGQVSFHSFSDFSKVAEGGEWDGKVGGSEKCCSKLNKKFSLGLKL